MPYSESHNYEVASSYLCDSGRTRATPIPEHITATLIRTALTLLRASNRKQMLNNVGAQ